MSEVLEKIRKRIQKQLSETKAKYQKNSLSLETTDIICGNIAELLSNALVTASTKDLLEEKHSSLESSIKAIHQAIAQQPQKLRNTLNELNIKGGVYSEVLEVIRDLELTPAEIPKPVDQTKEQDISLTLDSVFKDEQ